MTEPMFSQTAKKLVSHIDKTLSAVNEESIIDGLKQITSSKRIFVYGVGRSGLVGKAFAMRLVQMGLESFFIGETITPIVTKDDMVVVISNTGSTMSAIQTANIVRRVGGEVLVLTANPRSKLAHAANKIILIPTENNEPDPLAPLGTKFEEAAMVALDVIIAMLIKETGENEETMRSRHAILV